jgi:RES domain-containing protein
VASEQVPFSLPAVTTAGSLTLFRYCSYDVPFWVRLNTRPGRWHRIGDPPTQYWSMTPDAAWAELIRAEGLRSEEELDLVRMPLWTCRCPPAGLIDLGDETIRSRLGISLSALSGDAWAPCQDLGRELRHAGHPGVIAPCAALDGHANLTIFGARRQIDWRDRPALARTIPAAIVAVGRPAPGLVQRVHRPADPGSRPQLF